MSFKMPDYSDPNTFLSPGISLSPRIGMDQNQPVPPMHMRDRRDEIFGTHRQTFVPPPQCHFEETFDDDKYKSPYYWRAEQKKQEAYVRSLDIDYTKQLSPEQRSALSRLSYINEQKEISLGHAPSDPDPPARPPKQDDCVIQ